MRKSVGVGTVEWEATGGGVLLPPPQLDSRGASIRSQQTSVSVRHICYPAIYCTVSVVVVECCVDPDVPVIVIA